MNWRRLLESIRKLRHRVNREKGGRQKSEGEIHTEKERVMHTVRYTERQRHVQTDLETQNYIGSRVNREALTGGYTKMNRDKEG